MEERRWREQMEERRWRRGDEMEEMERDNYIKTVQHLQVFWKVWTCMSTRGNDCLKLYVTEVFFFWKIFVT